MDLGIKGKKAIVCASSKGLGRACAEALLKEGVNVIINSRNKSNLEKTFQELNKFADAKITMVQADLNTDEGKKIEGNRPFLQPRQRYISTSSAVKKSFHCN